MKSKMFKKVLSGVTACLLSATMLVGCAGGGTTSSKSSSDAKKSGSVAAGSSAKTENSGNVELSFWALQTRQKALDALTEKWNTDHPDKKVTVSYYDTDGIKDACKTASQSDSMPSMWFNWGGALGQYYVDNNVTYDLTKYAEENKWADKFSEGALNLCKLSGKVAGYPTSFNVIGVYYRKDIFEKAGVKVPTNIDEFEAVCKKLKESGTTPMITAGLNGWHTMRWIEQYIETAAGKELHDKLQSLTESWDNEAVVKAFERYKDHCEKGYYPDGFVTASPEDIILHFGQGLGAMDIEGQWFDGQINSNGIDMKNVGWFPFPSGTNRMSAFAEMTQFNAKLTDEELAAAVEYMDYIYSEENAKQYPDAYNLPLPIKGASMPEGQPNVPGLFEAANKNGTFTITDQALPAEVADVLFQCQDAIAGGSMKPAEAAKKIQEAIEAYKAK